MVSFFRPPIIYSSLDPQKKRMVCYSTLTDATLVTIYTACMLPWMISCLCLVRYRQTGYRLQQNLPFNPGFQTYFFLKYSNFHGYSQAETASSIKMLFKNFTYPLRQYSAKMWFHGVLLGLQSMGVDEQKEYVRK